MKLTDFIIKINQENVLKLIDCYPDSPVYEEVAADLEAILPEACQKLSPSAVVEFGDLAMCETIEQEDGEGKVLFCIESVGSEISQWSADFFEKGNYVKGMLADAIADDCLFQMDRMLEERVKPICKEKGYGITKRLEAPQDVPIEIQKTAWEVTRAEEEIGLKIKESYMLDPVKSNCQVYLLQEGCHEFRTEHDCRTCPMTGCKMRQCDKVSITVQKEDTIVLLEGKCGQTLLETLRNENIFVDAICAGRGTCGKCKVQFLEGCPIPKKEDENFFTKKELEHGWRLACKAVINSDCVVSIKQTGKETFAVLTEYESEKKAQNSAEKSRYGIAVDIGTTTIAMQLIDLSNETIEDTYTSLNHQKTFGADVVSRIQAANEGKLERLRQSILTDIDAGIEALLQWKDVAIEKMSISGNTTMIHLLMGYSCQGLGKYPFTPASVASVETTYQSLFGNNTYEFPIYMFPMISAYVGGDIVAGLLTCGFATNENISMLLDLGTNGEMAIGCKDKILVASAAAGPAFEGGNVVCGTGSIAGAISNATYADGNFHVQTIGDCEPTGICGTGVIAITHELRRNALMDETGLLTKTEFENGILLEKTGEKEIRFYQRDIREIQLAKSAIRAGIETLLHAYGVEAQDVDALYIAGGFGYKIDAEQAIGIGILPAEFRDKIKAVGNSSLKGSVLHLAGKIRNEEIERICDISEEIQLAQSNEFNDLYMRHMFF